MSCTNRDWEWNGAQTLPHYCTHLCQWSTISIIAIYWRVYIVVWGFFKYSWIFMNAWKKNAPPERISTNCELVSRVELTSNINNEMIALQIICIHYASSHVKLIHCTTLDIWNKKKHILIWIICLIILAKAAVFPYIYWNNALALQKQFTILFQISVLWKY